MRSDLLVFIDDDLFLFRVYFDHDLDLLKAGRIYSGSFYSIYLSSYHPGSELSTRVGSTWVNFTRVEQFYGFGYDQRGHLQYPIAEHITHNFIALLIHYTLFLE